MKSRLSLAESNSNAARRRQRRVSLHVHAWTELSGWFSNHRSMIRSSGFTLGAYSSLAETPLHSIPLNSAQLRSAPLGPPRDPASSALLILDKVSRGYLDSLRKRLAPRGEREMFFEAETGKRKDENGRGMKFESNRERRGWLRVGYKRDEHK